MTGLSSSNGKSDMTLRQRLFSFQGRIGRKQYWWASMLLALSYLLVHVLVFAYRKTALLDGRDPWFVFPSLIWAAIVIGPMSALVVKRLHDRNISGLVLLAPIAILSAIVLAGYIMLPPSQSGLLSILSMALVSYTFAIPFGVLPISVLGILLVLPKVLSGGAGLEYEAVALFLCSILTLFGIWFVREVGFRKGTVGPNTYGPPPGETATSSMNRENP